MQSNFEQALKLVLAEEGGYVNDKHDKGGETNYGITHKTYDDWRASMRLPKRSVKYIETDEIVAIYREQYADVIRFDELPAGLDYALFDFAVNSGPTRAVRFLQRIVGAKADGSLGVRTLMAVENYIATHGSNNAATSRDKDGAKALALKLCDDRLRYLKKLNDWKRYGKGWGSRVVRVKKNAETFARGGNTAGKWVYASNLTGAAKGVGKQSVVSTVADNKAATVGFMGMAGAALEQASEVKYGILSVFDSVPSWVWLALVAGIFAYIVWSKRREYD